MSASINAMVTELEVPEVVAMVTETRPMESMDVADDAIVYNNPEVMEAVHPNMSITFATISQLFILVRLVGNKIEHMEEVMNKICADESVVPLQIRINYFSKIHEACMSLNNLINYIRYHYDKITMDNYVHEAYEVFIIANNDINTLIEIRNATLARLHEESIDARFLYERAKTAMQFETEPQKLEERKADFKRAKDAYIVILDNIDRTEQTSVFFNKVDQRAQDAYDVFESRRANYELLYPPATA